MDAGVFAAVLAARTPAVKFHHEVFTSDCSAWAASIERAFIIWIASQRHWPVISQQVFGPNKSLERNGGSSCRSFAGCVFLRHFYSPPWFSFALADYAIQPSS